MRRSKLAEFHFLNPYQSSSPDTLVRANSPARGSKNILWLGNRLTAFRGLDLLSGKTGSRIMMPASNAYAGLGQYSDSANIRGSVLRVLNALFFIGNGLLSYDGASLSTNATSILQIKLLTSGVWSPTSYQAGLPQASAPTLAVRSSIGVGFTGRVKAGSYSAKAFLIRNATGGKGIASVQSNLVIVQDTEIIGKTLRVTFPAIGSSGADYWGLCLTPRNFGSTGPHFLYRKIAESSLTTIDGVPRSVEIEFTDGDLVGQDLAPIYSYPPPNAVFAAALGDCLLVDGAVGDTVTGVSSSDPGATAAQSLPQFPEEFPPDWRMYPPEPPTALIRGGDDYYYRFGKNTMGVFTYVGGTPPIYYQTMWSQAGISYPHNACVGEGGRIYAKTGRRGLVRVGADGQPESDWADDIARDIEDYLDEETVLGWDENSQTFCVMNNETIHPLQINKGWGAPCDVSEFVSGRILSAVPNGGSLYIAALNAGGSTIDLFEYNPHNAELPVLIEVKSDWHYAEAESEYLRLIDILTRFDNTANDVTVELFIDENDTTPVATWTITPDKTSRLPPIRFGQKAESFSVKVKHLTAGLDSCIEKITVSGVMKHIV